MSAVPAKAPVVAFLAADNSECPRYFFPHRHAPAQANEKADPQALENLGNRIIDLYRRAKDPAISREQIEAAFAELENLDPPATKLQELARRLDITRKLKKADAVRAMSQAVLERKGAFQRVEV